MPRIYVGISGWTYAPWRGNFYPQGLVQKHELAYASRRFGMLEINGTFYSLQRPSSFGAWYDATPPGFVFSLKGNKFLTHVRRLKDPHEPLASFLASGPLRLREKLGPILWQLPPFMTFDEERLKTFVSLLPHDTEAMARFAKKNAALDADRMWLEVDAKRPVRHAIEFRNQSFVTPKFIDVLREHNVAMVVADAASKFPSGEDVTADWVYVRLHGERVGHESGYTPEEIKAWAAKVRTFAGGGEPTGARRIGPAATPTPTEVKNGRDVFVAFDNTEIKQRSPVNAREMAEELGVGPRESVSEVLEMVSGKTAGVKKAVTSKTANKAATKTTKKSTAGARKRAAK